MFKVEKADFIAEKLAAELAPDQEQREVAKNGLEAIERRRLTSEDKSGRVEFDIDWPLVESGWYLACADDGDGMTKSELEKYSTTLAVVGANNNQGLTGNQGMGLKISGPTRHPEGVLIRSMKDGERTMVRLGFDKEREEYDLLPIMPGGPKVVDVSEDYFPEFIRKRGSGTVVTFLGQVEGDNTFVPSGRPKYWLERYLNGRFAELGDDGIDVFVRVAIGDNVDWPRTREEADERASRRGSGQFNFRRVRGTHTMWSEASDHQGPDFRGVVDLPGDEAKNYPPARMYWWVLPSKDESGIVSSSRTVGGGSIAVRYQGELYDWRTGRNADPLFARLGILFGKSRVGLILEPLGLSVRDDFARKSVLIGGLEILKSDAWNDAWSSQFRDNLPSRIRETINSEQARLEVDDPDRQKRIRNRLKDTFAMLRTPRFRAHDGGRARAGLTSVVDAGGEGSGGVSRSVGDGSRNGSARPRGLSDLLVEAIDEESLPAEPVFSIQELTVRWVSETDAADLALVESDGLGLRDRAAALVGIDGQKATEIAANVDFRMYQSVLASLLNEFNVEGDDEKSALITKTAREWFEQKLIETVIGIRMLENGGSWTPASLSAALDPRSLTAAFISDTFHTRAAIRQNLVKQLGSAITSA